MCNYNHCKLASECLQNVGDLCSNMHLNASCVVTKRDANATLSVLMRGQSICSPLEALFSTFLSLEQCFTFFWRVSCLVSSSLNTYLLKFCVSKLHQIQHDTPPPKNGRPLSVELIGWRVRTNRMRYRVQILATYDMFIFTTAVILNNHQM